MNASLASGADSIVLGVRSAAPFTVTATPAANTVKAGAKLSIAIAVERAAGFEGDIQLAGYDLPTNAAIPLVTVGKAATAGKVEMTVPANMKPGPYTFTINGAGQAPRDYGHAGTVKEEPRADPKKAKGNNVRVLVPSNAITVTVEAAGK